MIKEKAQIFLCYAVKDKPAARDLWEFLIHEGYNPWIDESSLVAGQQWEKVIPRTIQDSDCFLVLLSKHSISKRGYVQKEIRVALEEAERLPEGAIFIIPVRIEECSVPDHLKRFHWIDLFAKDGKKQLIVALSKVIEDQNIAKNDDHLRSLIEDIKKEISDPSSLSIRAQEVNEELVSIAWKVGQAIVQF